MFRTMQKIVVLPGVGLFSDPPKLLLISKLKEKFPDVDVEWFNWDHIIDIQLAGVNSFQDDQACGVNGGLAALQVAQPVAHPYR